MDDPSRPPIQAEAPAPTPRLGDGERQTTRHLRLSRHGMPSPGVRDLSSLRLRLPVAVAFLVAAAVTLSLLGSFLLLRKEFADRARQQLAQQMAGAAGYYGTQQSDLRGAARLIQDDGAVPTALRQGNRLALILRLKPYYADLTVDRLDVVDAQGRIVVRMEDPLSSGDSVAAHPSIRAALQGRENCGVEQDAAMPTEGSALQVTLPLYDGPGRLVGAVSVGRRLDSLFAAEIGHAVQATIHLRAVAALSSRLVGTPRPTSDACMFSPLSIAPADQITNRQEDGRAVLSGVVPVVGTDGRIGGGIEVVQPLSDIYDAITNVTRLLLPLGLVVAAISAGAGIGLSRGLTRRLSTLETAAAAVAAGDLDRQMPIQGKDEIAALAGSLGRMVQSLRERVALTSRLRATAEARILELEGLAEIAQLLTSAPSLATTLDEVATRICTIVGCPAAVVALLEEDTYSRARHHLVLRGAHGMQPRSREQLSQIVGATHTPDPDSTDRADIVSEERGAVGKYPFAFRRALRENTIQWLRITTLSSTATAADEAMLLRQVGLHEHWGAATAVPMVLQGQSQGVVICFTTEPDPLPEAESRVLRTVVGQATIAVENARLYAQSHDLAVLEERTRMARDLHDSVTQSLFSLNLAARAAENARTRNDPARLERALTMVGDLAQSSLSEMRALLFELRPAQLQGEGLLVALRNHAVAMEQRTGLTVQADLPDTCVLPAVYEDALYRVAQEALANVARHAQARHAMVRLRCMPEWVELTIEDDGIGMIPAVGLPADIESAAGRYGIRGMHERMAGLGGRLVVQPGSTTGLGIGTSVIARLPIHGQAAARAEARIPTDAAPTNNADPRPASR
jgi:signal transduction histidine kinase